MAKIMKGATTMLFLLVVKSLFFASVTSFSRSFPVSSPSSSFDTRFVSRRKGCGVHMASTATASSSSSSSPASSSSSSSDNNPTENSRENLKSKFRDDMMAGAIGGWEELHGNWVLRPPSRDEPPRALLHFLGGALVGASPHITYRYMLERLAEEGFLVVATPYQLSFDHLETCDEIITRFELMAPAIAREYGALPVVGIGHSCGSLLQLLITSLFPDTPRAANALMSFNNKPVTEAVPFFEEVFAPFFTSISTNNSTRPSDNDALRVGLRLVKSATEGELPSDELLKDLTKFVLIPPFFPSSKEGMKIPKDIRDSVNQVISPSVSALTEIGVLPFLNQAIVSLEQIPKLVDEVAQHWQVADGARDFFPTPNAVKSAARKAYRARRTLIVQFADDDLDESDKIEQLLKEAESITRMKRPMVAIDVQRKVLEGGHVTPLLAPPLDVAVRAEDILGSDTSRERLQYEQASTTVDELVRWLDEGNL